MKSVQHAQGVNVSCTFQDRQDTSQKSCSIRYGPCSGKQSHTVDQMSVDESPNIITVMLKSQVIGQTICYTISATNTTYAVIVEGQIGEY